MICPFCDCDNIAGADSCDACGQDLAPWDVTRGGTDLSHSVTRTPISRVRVPPAIIVEPTATLREVVDRLVGGNVGCVLVAANGELVGIFSERDLLMKVAHRFDQVQHNPVREFMTASPETLGPDATIAFTLNRMDVGGFRHIPIVDGKRPLGVVSVRDLLRYVYDHYASAKAG